MRSVKAYLRRSTVSFQAYHKLSCMANSCVFCLGISTQHSPAPDPIYAWHVLLGFTCTAIFGSYLLWSLSPKLSGMYVHFFLWLYILFGLCVLHQAWCWSLCLCWPSQVPHIISQHIRSHDTCWCVSIWAYLMFAYLLWSEAPCSPSSVVIHLYLYLFLQARCSPRAVAVCLAMRRNCHPMPYRSILLWIYGIWRYIFPHSIFIVYFASFIICVDDCV